MDVEPRRRGALLAVVLALGGLGLLAAGGWSGGSRGGSAGSGSVPIVLAVRGLDAGTVLAAADVDQVRISASEAVVGLAHAESDVVGRRLAVAVPAGQPLSTALLTAAPAVAAGRRLVRVALDASAVPPDLAVGDVVDVVAAVPDGNGGGRVVTVAAAEVVALAGGGSPVATLDVATADAARLVWAQSFAKSLRLLVRAAPGDAPPPDVGGLSPP